MIDTYERLIAAARTAFDQRPGITFVLAPDSSELDLHRWFIEFCARGVAMTEPVEGWIRRAGERCRRIGMERTGLALLRHASQEADHHLMFVDDVRALVAGWNRRPGVAQLDADALLQRPPEGGALVYRRLHEEVIAGDHPYGQLAIEYEIERLSLTHGRGILARAQESIGRDQAGVLGFLSDHVALDVGHTAFNRAELAALLTAHPETQGPLLAAGAAALDAYGRFLDDCLDAVRSAGIRNGTGRPEATRLSAHLGLGVG